MNITKEKIAIAAADARLEKAGLPTYTQLLSALLQGLTTKDRRELDDTLRRSRLRQDCGDFVLMTPAAWGAIKVAADAIDA
jgi:hypothetical protein